jgi:hypothetical protein
MVLVSRFPIRLNQRSRCCVMGTEFTWLAACNDSEGQLVSLQEVILSYSQEFQLFRRCVGLRRKRPVTAVDPQSALIRRRELERI